MLDLEWIWAESETGKIVRLEQGVEAGEKGKHSKNHKGLRWETNPQVRLSGGQCLVQDTVNGRMLAFGSH